MNKGVGSGEQVSLPLTLIGRRICGPHPDHHPAPPACPRLVAGVEMVIEHPTLTFPNPTPTFLLLLRWQTGLGSIQLLYIRTYSLVQAYEHIQTNTSVLLKQLFTLFLRSYQTKLCNIYLQKLFRVELRNMLAVTLLITMPMNNHNLHWNVQGNFFTS